VSEDARARIRFCPQCGSGKIVLRVPRRDDKERPVCDGCGYIHYVGPVLAAGAILHDGGRICLVRRDLEPGRGKWTFPGGFVDLEESCADAALRETMEETGNRGGIERLLGVYNSLGPRRKRVAIVVYVARLQGEPADTTEHTEEVQEVRWFEPAALPWDAFAFESTAQALRDYLPGR